MFGYILIEENKVKDKNILYIRKVSRPVNKIKKEGVKILETNSEQVI